MTLSDAMTFLLNLTSWGSIIGFILALVYNFFQK